MHAQHGGRDTNTKSAHLKKSNAEHSASYAPPSKPPQSEHSKSKHQFPKPNYTSENAPSASTNSCPQIRLSDASPENGEKTRTLPPDLLSPSPLYPTQTKTRGNSPYKLLHPIPTPNTNVSTPSSSLLGTNLQSPSPIASPSKSCNPIKDLSRTNSNLLVLVPSLSAVDSNGLEQHQSVITTTAKSSDFKWTLGVMRKSSMRN
jgi:hypothetical protein